MSLFPILADANPPSNLAGLDVSLAAGQMTALDGADSFTMTASTLTANGTPALWVDIVDLVVNPEPTPALQAVLNAGSSADTADGGVASMSLTDGTDVTSLAPASLQVSASSGDYSSNHTAFGINAVDNTGATLEASLTASALSMLSGTDTTSLSVGSLSMVDATASTTLTDGSLVLMDIPNTSIATLTYASVAVGKDTDYVEMTKDNLVLANASVSTTITPASISMGDATYNSAITAPTLANGEKLVVASSKQIELDAEQNVVLSAGADSVSFLRNAVLTTSAGGSTDQYLSILVNDVPYRISLLAQPVFPLRTISTISIGGGQNIFVQEPYIQCNFFTVSFTVSGWSGATGSSNFEILSYPTDAFQEGQSYSVRKVFINGNGVYSFTQQNYTPERYNALQFFQTSANAFTVSSWTVNGTQQIASPNPVPLVCPPA